MVISTKEIKNTELDKSWYLMDDDYWSGYTTYNIYTQNKDYYKAKQHHDKLDGVGMNLVFAFMAGLIISGIVAAINFDEKAGLNNLGVTILLIICVIITGLLLISIFINGWLLSSLSKKLDKYHNSEEYKADKEEIKRLDKLAYEKIKEKKASDLIIVYDTLENKNLSRQKKIKIIKEHIK